jgi:hypothetical protein
MSYPMLRMNEELYNKLLERGAQLDAEITRKLEKQRFLDLFPEIDGGKRYELDPVTDYYFMLRNVVYKEYSIPEKYYRKHMEYDIPISIWRREDEFILDFPLDFLEGYLELMRNMTIPNLARYHLILALIRGITIRSYEEK